MKQIYSSDYHPRDENDLGSQILFLLVDFDYLKNGRTKLEWGGG